MDICIDFDGTCVSHMFPEVGKDIGAAPVLRELMAQGHNLILFTMRDDIDNPTSTDPEILEEGGKYLTNAISWFTQNKIVLYGIQSNPTQSSWTQSPKAYGQLYIDDAALGCPLIHPEQGRPYVDWIAVRKYLVDNNIITE